MKSTFGAPGLARTGAGHAGCDSPMVRPMTPGNVVPGLYSLRLISCSLAAEWPDRKTSTAYAGVSKRRAASNWPNTKWVNAARLVQGAAVSRVPTLRGAAMPDRLRVIVANSETSTRAAPLSAASCAPCSRTC